jgi:AcrR family transcriptional regulator
VARPIDAARRAELLKQTFDYVVEHGLADLSLRPLAAALGTSSRMLVHYFGTKEQLVAQALVAARPDVEALMNSTDESTASLTALARMVWREMSGGTQEPRVRLLLEVMGLALTQPDRYGAMAADAIHAWVNPVAGALRRTGLGPAQARARATALVSGLRGIAHDRYLTGDRARTDAAAEQIITLLA